MNNKLELFKDQFDARIPDPYDAYYIDGNRLMFEFNYDVNTIIDIIEDLVVRYGLSYSVKDYRILTVRNE